MKKNISVVMLLLVTLTLVAVPAHAAKQANDFSEINLSVFVPCAAGGAGEIVDLTGTLHTLITFTINGRNASGTAHFQPQGLSGFGETTGDKYQATGVTKDSSFKASLQNGQFNQTFVNNFRIIGQGPGNNFLVHEVAHVTFNANGRATVLFDNLSVNCK